VRAQLAHARLQLRPNLIPRVDTKIRADQCERGAPATGLSHYARKMLSAPLITISRAAMAVALSLSPSPQRGDEILQ
jgi:hypothetical protein